jgi:hypothetical protein
MKYRYSLVANEATRKTRRHRIEGIPLVLGRVTTTSKKIETVPPYVIEKMIPETSTELKSMKKGELLEMCRDRGFTDEEVDGKKKGEIVDLLLLDLSLVDEIHEIIEIQE